jgi:SAM-dependent methyltransferase
MPPELRDLQVISPSGEKNSPAQAKDYLWPQLLSLPYFRALLRSVEARFYESIPLPSPCLDLGCGDGHFASMAFEQPIEVGLDPWAGPIRQASQTGAYHSLTQADGARMPFPQECFASSISNSVLEHIPEIDAVLKEVHRVLKPGAPFIFCVPNDRFLPNLSIGERCDRLGSKRLGDQYRAFFNRISRHQHCDPPELWQARLSAAGFTIDRWWHYFSPAALHALEWGHYLGAPSLLTHALTGRWILIPKKWNLAITERYVRRYYDEPAYREDGVYTFYITHRSGDA